MSRSLATSPTGNRSARFPASRQADLASFVAEKGQVTVADLATRFDVSPDTIRRDLDQLDADGILIRTHGGAVSLSAVPRADTGVDIRMRLQTSAKDRIGALAASLVTDGTVLMINAGTTSLSMARHLKDQRELTIATNNLRIPAEISPKVCRDLYLFGGSVRLGAQAVVGPLSFRADGNTGDIDIKCDLAVIGVGAISASGYTTSHLAEAVMMGQMMKRATRVIVLADSSKFGRQLFAQISPLDAGDVLVTDQQPPQDLQTALEESGVQVIVADGN
ncbi:DeoR/GlpR family DNA-binding transcription regulator [Arthrobacter sp. ISL-5]|uniref:DeoR/GlpR family DNA-binding transcription regulator n=1 Tax=Arthrobacter sp. ISL-5 TaxID=2819111 RepID=UPI001BE753DB|nr:DeoR/GlpR family DNA-binding transcription regulator [Arthrobacter sp. ISL-5]MBT2555975.1 DeoR/GlpR transcriptional regulator [Arthrobacter sp. ISL-5]